MFLNQQWQVVCKIHVKKANINQVCHQWVGRVLTLGPQANKYLVSTMALHMSWHMELYLKNKWDIHWGIAHCEEVFPETLLENYLRHAPHKYEIIVLKRFGTVQEIFQRKSSFHQEGIFCGFYSLDSCWNSDCFPAMWWCWLPRCAFTTRFLKQSGFMSLHGPLRLELVLLLALTHVDSLSMGIK